MNTERTSSSAQRPSVSSARRFSGFSLSALSLPRIRVFFAWLAAALVLAGLTATASQAGLKSASASGTGAVLALAAQLRSASLHAAANGASSTRHTPSGRTLLPRRMLHSGALVGRAAAASVVPISGGVQTYDVDSPPPAFRPLVGFGSVGALNNSSTNPPVYATALTPTNMTPVWSADETFLVYASNRTLTGGVNADGTNADGSAGSRFHLWAISVNGGEAFQITASTGPASTFDPNTGVLINAEGELFPTLSQNNLTVAFTSDAATPGTQNLYALPFSYSMLSTGTAAPTNLTQTTANPNPPASLTLRAPMEAASSMMTGFSQVQRPTFSPNDPQLIVFSALSVIPTGYSDQYAGVNHLYYLYISSGGFSPGNNVSFPGKLTDGPAGDTDPTFAPDGTYIAFSSTADANGFTVNPNNAAPTNPPALQDPNASQSLSSGTAPGGLRSVFLISGGGSTGAAFGTVPASGTANLTSTGGRVSQGSTAGLDDFGPAWSNFANQNQYTNPSGQFGYLAFARSEPAAGPNHDIVFFQVVKGVSQPSTETLVPETDRAGANAAITLNTDDNAGETVNGTSGASANPGNALNPGNAFDDIYPTWSPFLSIFSIAYSSNRTVTYNNPVGNQPVEIAASVAPGGSVTAAAGQDQTPNFSVGTSYSGLLVSQVLNLDPPTLLRFSPNEVVHVQALGTPDANGNSTDPVNGTPNKLAATGGQKITLTVRLSDREATIADTGGPNGGPRVYVQIKDPDGKYDDSQNAEHKVFGKDSRYNGQPNQPLSDVTSDAINQYISNNTNQGYGNIPPGVGFIAANKYVYPSYMDGNDKVGQNFVSFVNPRGAHGGHYFTPDSNNPSSTYTFVGKGVTSTPGTRTVVTGPFGTTLSDTDPAQFIPQGPEYEAQVVNPQFAAVNPTPNTLIGNPTVTVAYPAGYTTVTPTTANPTGRVANTTGAVGDYLSPYWLAGVNDQGAFTGGAYASNTGASALPTAQNGVVTPNGMTQTDRPTAGYTTAGRATDGTRTTTTHPAEWLQLTRVPTGTDGTQNGDANGGVLYTVTWQTPTSGSDFYVDVIAYDNAIFPNVPNSSFGGRTTNWRIYDNVGGFSTNSTVGGNDILLVSDYALGQKFAATTFGGRNVNLNLVPKLFGTESYLSAVDVNILPDSVYAGEPVITNPVTYNFNPAVQVFGDFSPGVTFYDGYLASTQNALGVGSYIDGDIDDGTRFDGQPSVQSQRYSIWRILSRGPVPASTLSNYLPNRVSQPAIADAADPTYSNVPAATILDAQRCVVWLSPYTGDVLAEPGTIDDPGNIGAVGMTNPRQSTTSILTSFVQSGGRLCITGQDVGSTLTQSGTVGNSAAGPGPHGFLPDVLNATLTANSSGINVLTATANRITGSPFYDNTDTVAHGRYLTTIGPIEGPYGYRIPNFPYQDNLVLGDSDFSDGGLSQIPALRLPGGASIQGQQDAITAVNGAITAATYGAGGPGAIVYHDDPYKAGNTGTLPNGGTGSRVVYAAFGLEALSQDYYASASPNPDAGSPLFRYTIIPHVVPRNPRSEVLHNIVSFLRTGRVSGTITQTSGTGQGGGLPIGGVTVYLRPTGGAPPSRPAFSALTSSGGSFTIAGVEPGTYTLVAIKPGFQRAVSNSNVSFTVEGDVSKTGATLTMTPQAPGSIAGTVHDTANNPIAGSVVTFTSQDNSITKTATTVNGSVPGNAAENYFIQNVPVTNYTGTASSPTNPSGQAEYTAAKAPDAPPAGSPTTTPDFSKGVTVQPNTTIQNVNFTLTPILATISGTVTSAAGGAPIAGATVTVTNSAGAVVGTPVVTAADGTYKLTGIPATQTATTYTLTATAPGFAASAPVSVPGVYLGSIITGVNLTEAPIAPGTIKGTVTYAPGGVVSGPVAGAIVTYTAPGGAAQTVTTAADGTYTIPTVPPATYTVSAIGPNNANGKMTTSAAAAQQVAVTSGNTSTADFALTAISPSFSGTVVSAATTSGTTTTPGKPLAGVTITVTDGAGNPVATTPSPIKTAADGTYTTGPLAPGTYTLTASRAGYTASAPIGPATVQLGDAMTGDNFTLTAVPPGSITGTVKDNQGNPVAGATVTFNSTDGTVHPNPATTDSAGVYVIPPAGTAANVPASTYTGTAVGTSSETGAAQYGTAPAQTVSVPAGGSATANFVLPVNLASVSGTVTDIQSSAAVSGATVTLLGPAGTVVAGPVTTGAGGAFSFTGINALQSTQTYTVNVTAPKYFPGSSPVTLSLGDAITGIAVTLNEQATLVGLVTDGSQNATGQPLSGVTITVTDASGNAVMTTPATLTTTSGTTTAPDGQPANYTATLLPGKYTITATKGSYTSQTSALITLTNAAPVRVNFALISSIGTLGGLVTDQNGTGLDAGATVTAVPTGSTTGLTFTTTASSSAGPDGQPINYSGQLSQGTYTVTVTKGSRTSAPQKVTIAGGTFKRLDFTGASGLPALHTFAAGLQFVSTPYDYSNLGFNGLFGALNTAPAGTTSNGNRSNVAVYNPLTNAYALDPNAPADALRLGVGYWVYLKNPTAVTQQGATPTGSFVSVSLGQGWNQIGVPNPSASGTPIASLMFDNGTGGKITFAQASGPQYNLVTHPLYGYAGGGYQALSTSGVLTPWNAYWIYVNAAATLEIPIQSSATTTTTTTTTTPPLP